MFEKLWKTQLDLQEPTITNTHIQGNSDIPTRLTGLMATDTHMSGTAGVPTGTDDN